MTAPARPVLTAPEQEALELVAAGMTLAQIARRLGVGEPAVEHRMRRVMYKLGAESSPHAVLLACRAGLLDGRPLTRHGDHAGYEAHIRRRIPLCEPCRAGEKAYRAGLREARQAQEGLSLPVSATFSASATSGASGLESASEAHSPVARPKNHSKAA